MVRSFPVEAYVRSPGRFVHRTHATLLLNASDAAIPSLQQPSAVPQKAESEGDWEDIEDEYDGAKNVGSLTGRSTAAVGGDAAGVLVLDWSNMNQLRSVEEPLATSNGSAQKNSIQSHREARTASYRSASCPFTLVLALGR